MLPASGFHRIGILPIGERGITVSNLTNLNHEVKSINRVKIDFLPGLPWLLWAIVWMSAEIALVANYHESTAKNVFPFLLIAFVIFEGNGLRYNRKQRSVIEVIDGQNVNVKKGGTLSECMWFFIQEGTARRYVGYAVALAFAFRGATFPYLLEYAEVDIVMDLPWWALSAGVFAWLVQHFALLGRRG